MSAPRCASVDALNPVAAEFFLERFEQIDFRAFAEFVGGFLFEAGAEGR